jgi:hypothetical protein
LTNLADSVPEMDYDELTELDYNAKPEELGPIGRLLWEERQLLLRQKEERQAREGSVRPDKDGQGGAGLEKNGRKAASLERMNRALDGMFRGPSRGAALVEIASDDDEAS